MFKFYWLCFIAIKVKTYVRQINAYAANNLRALGFIYDIFQTSDNFVMSVSWKYLLGIIGGMHATYNCYELNIQKQVILMMPRIPVSAYKYVYTLSG